MVLLISLSQYVFGAWFASIQSGAWDNSDVWPSWHNGSTPVSGDGVSVGTGHIVTYNGDLNFSSGQIQLNGGRLNINGDLTIGSGVTFGSTSLGGTLFVNGDLILNSDFPIDGPLNVIVTGDVVAYSNIYFNPGNSIFVVQGDLTHYADLNAHNDGQLIVQGNYTTESGGSTEIASGGDIYTFGSTTCSGSGCLSIQDQSDWESLPNPPGGQYVSSGEIQLYSSGTFTVPAGVYAIKVEAWGGGAGGFDGAGNGGGGGAYASKIIQVSPGEQYDVVVGSGGLAENNGGDTEFGNELVVADGANGQTGGQASGCIGDLSYSGGNGGYGGGNSGGGGGGSAWPDANGNTGGDGGGNTGGLGGTGAGNGGAGGAGNDTPGQIGNIPGGGGGGGGNKAIGGNGANGQINISWSDLPYVSFTNASTYIVESNTILNIEVEISSTSTSTVSTNFSVATIIATTGTDFSLLTSSPISISPGSQTTTISVEIIDDNIVDQFEESITLTLYNSTNATIGTPASHTINIIENEFSDPSLVVAPTEICISNQVVFIADPPQGNCGGINAFYYSTEGSIWQQIPNNQLAYNGCEITYTPPTAGNFFYYYEHSNFGNSNVVGVAVEPQPTVPTVDTKSPNLASICEGTGVSATFNAGSGGVGCSDDYVVIIDGGTPVAYTPGNTVGTMATTSIEIQGRRANCTSGVGCTGTSYITLVGWSVEAQPTASAGGSQTICELESATVSGASSTNGTILWTHNGSGTLSNETTLTPTYTSVSADAGNTVTLTMTVSNPPCADATATYNVTIISPSATVTQYTPDNECPQLDPNLGFEPNNDGPYDAGSSEIQFQVQNNDPTTDWSFDFNITDANGLTGFVVDSVNATGNNSYNQDILSSSGTFNSIPAADNLITITARVKNIPGEQIEVDFNLSNISDANGCSTDYTENRDTVIMNVMPVVGQFE